MKWSRTALVLLARIGSSFEKGSDRVRTASSNGAMQRGDAAFVLGVGICPCPDEVRDHLVLGIPIPVDGAGTSVCRVVDRFGSSSVPGAYVRSSPDEGVRQSW